MSLHLFATPVQCTHCGATVDDPKLDHCPNCHALLKERRTPRRIAGVERRYGNVRFLVGFLRLVGGLAVLMGVLVVLFGIGDGDGVSTVVGALGALGGAAALFAIAAFFDIVIDIEENTRASFRVQQLILEHFETRPVHVGAAPAAAPEPEPAREP